MRASARPRKSEKVPSVTISGGRFEPGDEQRVQAAAERADADRSRRRRATDRQPASFHQHAEEDRAQAHQRADGQIDAAGEDDRRHDQREQADLHRVAEDVGDVVRGEEAAAERVEEDDFERR